MRMAQLVKRPETTHVVEMSSKLVAVIFGVACAGLAGWLVMEHSRHQEAIEAATSEHAGTQNELKRVQTQLAQLEIDHEKAREQVTSLSQSNLVYSNKLAGVVLEMSSKTDALNRTAEELSEERLKLEQAKKAEMLAMQSLQQTRDKLGLSEERVLSLEGEAEGLNKRLLEMSAEMAELEGQIVKTKEQLASASSDRDFLATELNRLQGEKNALLSRMQDLEFLGEKVKELKAEIAEAQRREWSRSGRYAGGRIRKAGGAMLLKMVDSPEETEPANAPSLEVELDTRGGGKIVKPEAP